MFEGSCRLIPLQEIVKECITLADEFIPELIETLASQMNPQIVCATAGLCNSVRVDRLLRSHGLLASTSANENKIELPKAEVSTYAKNLILFGMEWNVYLTLNTHQTFWAVNKPIISDL